ncbi:MAG: PAAR domain-containing protein [Chloroflexi bacterium]|nr:PAAR domain-containing protein [Chloroflexota bacterium]MBV9546593.1 PAAR domain-containing protein [Chloroflexota bacterium]
MLGDNAPGVCTHIVLVPSPPGAPVPTPLPHPYTGQILQGCETSVLIGGKPAAVLGSGLTNVPPHIPTPPGTAPGPGAVPQNDGKIIMGSATVLIGGKPAARVGDSASPCVNSTPPGIATIVGPGVPTVIIGG